MIAFLRNLVTHDLGLKLFALGLAVLIWTTVRFAGVTGPQTTRTFRDVPVRVVAADADVRAFRAEPAGVDVTVRGDKPTVEQLSAKLLRATVDLTEGERAVRKRVEVAMPPGITLVRVAPTDVDVAGPVKP